MRDRCDRKVLVPSFQTELYNIILGIVLLNKRTWKIPAQRKYDQHNQHSNLESTVDKQSGEAFLKNVVDSYVFCSVDNESFIYRIYVDQTQILISKRGAGDPRGDNRRILGLSC